MTSPNSHASRSILSMAALGLVSGSLSTFRPEWIKSSLNPLSSAIGIDGVGLFPGLVFAAIVAFGVWYLGRPRSASWTQCLLVYLTAVIAWVCAVHIALYIYDVLDDPISLLQSFGQSKRPVSEIEQRLITGLLAGATGASVLFAGNALFVVPLRSLWGIAIGCLIGAGAGLMLWFALESDLEYLGPWLLFAIWQSTAAAWLGFLMSRSVRGTNPEKQI
ncbi:MAG: hypothetical protein ACR2OW_05115 [Methyloligellaceae bacterium]